jgi:hypothetical protein
VNGVRNVGGVLGKTGLVSVMGVAAYITLRLLDDWVGNWTGPVWLLSTFLFSYLIGIALGSLATGARGLWIGAFCGSLVVAVPSAGYLLSVAASGEGIGSRVDDLDLPQLWAAFAVVSAGMGALALHMGARVRIPSRKHIHADDRGDA